MESGIYRKYYKRWRGLTSNSLPERQRGASYVKRLCAIEAESQLSFGNFTVPEAEKYLIKIYADGRDIAEIDWNLLSTQQE